MLWTLFINLKQMLTYKFVLRPKDSPNTSKIKGLGHVFPVSGLLHSVLQALS